MIGVDIHIKPEGIGKDRLIKTQEQIRGYGNLGWNVVESFGEVARFAS